MSMPPRAACFADFRDRHRGETVIVCGCGASLRQLRRPERFVTIGVNDVGRLFTPDYLIVVNERRQFTPDRYVHVEQSQAKAVFSQLDLAHPRAVRFRLGKRGGTDRADADSLHYTNNSPYIAVNLARHMGAARIGLIGVDFDGDHFFGSTGRHPLAGQLAQIDLEYAALSAACRTDGIELVNLSPSSRLASLQCTTLDAWLMSDEGNARIQNEAKFCTTASTRRVFFVHYRFLSCGTIFDTGLREAARTLGIVAENADWDDEQLPQKVERFHPDLLFVVHGRRFVQRWRERFAKFRSAVWLLDEPYEVDDTATWSKQFDLVFVNDAATLSRHRHAHELPVAYAPVLHYAPPAVERVHRVGFVGGANPTRECLLGSLARRGLLDYLVGGPWRDTRLSALCLAANVPAKQTAALYRTTAIVVNVFRDHHHFNRAGIDARAMNPRICEALACGALVISEPREGLARLIPELPTFRSEAEAAALIENFLANPAERLRVQRACIARLADATYSQRLRSVMDIASELPKRLPSLSAPEAGPKQTPTPVPAHGGMSNPCERERVVPFDDDWDDVGGVARRASDGTIVIDAGARRGPGVERGLTSRMRFDAVDLTFEVCLGSGACLLAKVHQADPIDQTSNSYHLRVDERRAYLARHQHVFHQFESPRLVWTRFRVVFSDGVLSLLRNDRLLHRVRDQALTNGFAFVGAQGGSMRLRELRVSTTEQTRSRILASDNVDELLTVAAPKPRISIVTTVYDRSDCLRHCIASVRRLAFADFEHLIVADYPPPDVMERIRTIVSSAGDARVGLFNLKRRFNNWGIAPAAAGLRRARGEYVAFLSDDNGYTSDHFNQLVRMLDRDSALGFVYSSCRYDGRPRAQLSRAETRAHRSRPAPVSARAFRAVLRRRSPVRHDGLGLAPHRLADASRRALAPCRPAELHLPAGEISSDDCELGPNVEYGLVISYCVAVHRPTYARLLLADLVEKTSVPFEILVWLNVANSTLDAEIDAAIGSGVPLRVVGRTPANIGMVAYEKLFRAARYLLIAQIDDDVVCISRGIAQRADRLFRRFPTVRQLVSDVWQDEHTTGARPPIEQYRAFDASEGLYIGPIDGWFAIYHRSILPLLLEMPMAPYFALGAAIRARLARRGRHGLLDRGMKVFHVTGPEYAAAFGMLTFEIEKYRRLQQVRRSGMV